MRKRKSPIVLVTALVVVVAGIVGFNFAASKPGGNPAEQPPAPQTDVKPVGEARPAESTTSIAGSVKTAMGSKGTGTPEAGPKMPPGMPGGGSIMLNPGAGAKPEKPKPNSSATSAQWYDKDSALGSGKG